MGDIEPTEGNAKDVEKSNEENPNFLRQDGENENEALAVHPGPSSSWRSIQNVVAVSGGGGRSEPSKRSMVEASEAGVPSNLSYGNDRSRLNLDDLRSCLFSKPEHLKDSIPSGFQVLEENRMIIGRVVDEVIVRQTLAELTPVVVGDESPSKLLVSQPTVSFEGEGIPAMEGLQGDAASLTCEEAAAGPALQTMVSEVSTGTRPADPEATPHHAPPGPHIDFQPPSYTSVEIPRVGGPRRPTPPFVPPVPPPSYGEVMGLRYMTRAPAPPLILNVGRELRTVMWGHRSQAAYCDRCHAVVITRVRHYPCLLTHVSAGLLFILMCWPCCVLPYCLDYCQSTKHYCPVCETHLGSHYPLL